MQYLYCVFCKQQAILMRGNENCTENAHTYAKKPSLNMLKGNKKSGEKSPLYIFCNQAAMNFATSWASSVALSTGKPSMILACWYSTFDASVNLSLSLSRSCFNLS